MQRWDPLNERQLVLLRRIADGEDLSGPDDIPHRHSARALASRQLVKINRRDGWHAAIEDAGRYYLAQGHHPDDPRYKPASAPPANRETKLPGVSPAARNGIVTQARELIARLQAEDGMVRIEEPDDQARATVRRVIHAAKQHDLVPAGCLLRHTGRDVGDIVIRLYRGDDVDETEWNRIRLESSRQVTGIDLAMEKMAKDPTHLRVSEAQLPRALELVRAIAVEAHRRGHRLVVNTKPKHPTLTLKLDKVHRSVTVSEDTDQVPHRPTPDEERNKRRYGWEPHQQFDNVPSGRLRLEVRRAGGTSSDSWVDTNTSPLESKITKIVREIEAGVLADEEQRLAYQRAMQEFDEQRRREEAETRTRWQAAIEHARPAARDKLRTDIFLAAANSWAAAVQIRALCDALQHADFDTHDRAANLTQWMAWARDQADRLDPALTASILADVDFDIEPEPDDLRPFLGTWSHHQPREEYRSDADERHLATVQDYAKTWHHGMRGKPNWWRN